MELIISNFDSVLRRTFTWDSQWIRCIAAARDGMAEGSRRTGIDAGRVIAVLRSHDEATNIGVAQGACRFAGKGVVGFDLAGDESLYRDLPKYSRPFAIARASGLGLTCHAAEAVPGRRLEKQSRGLA